MHVNISPHLEVQPVQSILPGRVVQADLPDSYKQRPHQVLRPQQVLWLNQVLSLFHIFAFQCQFPLLGRRSGKAGLRLMIINN